MKNSSALPIFTSEFERNFDTELLINFLIITSHLRSPRRQFSLLIFNLLFFTSATIKATRLSSKPKELQPHATEAFNYFYICFDLEVKVTYSSAKDVRRARDLLSQHRCLHRPTSASRILTKFNDSLRHYSSSAPS